MASLFRGRGRSSALLGKVTLEQEREDGLTFGVFLLWAEWRDTGRDEGQSGSGK